MVAGSERQEHFSKKGRDEMGNCWATKKFIALVKVIKMGFKTIMFCFYLLAINYSSLDINKIMKKGGCIEFF